MVATAYSADASGPVPKAVDKTQVGRRSLARSVLSSWEGRVGLAGLGLFGLIIFVGPHVAPYSPYATGVGPILSSPSMSHWFGTDEYGRDVLSRVLNGGLGIVWPSFLGLVLAFLSGGVFGIFAGYRGGVFDGVFSRVVDVFLSLPPLLLVLLIIAGAGTSTAVIVAALGIVFAPRVARVIRGSTQAVSRNEYVDAARVRGESLVSISRRELLPNISGPLSVEFAVRYVHAIIFVATLSFLGLGAQPPSPNWGLMVSDGQAYMTVQPFAVLAPALFIAALAVSVNFLGDATASALARDQSVQGEG
jgi:peptide/nickel transport system permease protein